MLTREVAEATYPSKPLGEVATFLDHRRRPVKQSERKVGIFPYYGANGLQGTIDNFIFDEPLILLAEDGGHFDNPDRGIAYEISGKTWVNNHAHVIKPSNGELNLTYLRRVLENYDVRPFINGSTRSKLTKAQAERIPIPLPPLEEQRQIAAILDKADLLRRKRSRALQLADNLTQSIFVEMFGDERSSPFEIKVLDTITDKITDGAHFTPTYVDSGVPFLRVTDIQDEAINWQAVKYIPEEEHNELTLRCRPETGDVLLSKNGTIGISRYIDWENAFSIFVSLCLIKPTKNILSGRYLATFLKTAAAQRQLRKHAKTGTVTNLHLTEIRKMLIPLPTIEDQRGWEEMEARLLSGSRRQFRALNNSEALFSSLRSRAFSGQL
jgi:type I restriction enzyme S subunit